MPDNAPAPVKNVPLLDEFERAAVDFNLEAETAYVYGSPALEAARERRNFTREQVLARMVEPQS